MQVYFTETNWEGIIISELFEMHKGHLIACLNRTDNRFIHNDSYGNLGPGIFNIDGIDYTNYKLYNFESEILPYIRDEKLNSILT